MILDFKNSNQIHSVKFPRIFFLICQIIFILFTAIFFVFYLFPKPHPAPTDFTSNNFIGLTIIFFSLLIETIIIFSFYNRKLKHLQKPKEFDFEKSNLIDFFDFESSVVLWKTIIYAERNKIAVSPTILANEILINNKIKFIFERLDINFDLIKRHLQTSKPIDLSVKQKYTPEFILLMKEISGQLAKGQSQIEISDLFVGLAKFDPVFNNLITQLKISLDEAIGAANWLKFYLRETRPLKFFEPENLIRFKGIGKDWAYGYTPNLDKYSVDLTKKLENKNLNYHIIGHEKTISAMEQILARRGENNVILVGEPGTGRKTSMIGFIKLVNEGATYQQLAYKRMVELDMNSFCGGINSGFDLNARLAKILNEAIFAGNVIIFIDDFHNFLSEPFNIKEALIPYLKSNRFQFIGITDHANYHQKIEFDPSLKILLEKVEIKETSEQETMEILQDILLKLEKEYKIKVIYQSLKEIIDLVGRLETNLPFPEKAISLLNESMSAAQGRGIKKLKPELIDEILSQKLGFAVGEAKADEREKLLNLEGLMGKKLVNQETAVKAIAQALRKSRAGIARKKPIGSFLFLGSTGVGKTQTAKALSEIYFNSPEMIRLDLTEYQQADSINRILGQADQKIISPFLSKTREKQFSVILLDEIEKANKNVMNLFMQVIDEGYLTDDYGEKTSFLNSIIIATSNAGAKFIREKIQTGIDLKILESELIDYVLKNNIFSPEFINRFDAVIVFTPLSKEHLMKIAFLELTELNKKLKPKQIEIDITTELLYKLAEIGFDPVFGARALNRAISEKMESVIARGILENKYKLGEKIKIDAEKL